MARPWSHKPLKPEASRAIAVRELSYSKLAAWATIAFAGVVAFGWVVEATVKWAVAWALSHWY